MSKKNLKLNIKNTQIAEALKITKEKLATAASKPKKTSLKKKAKQATPVKEETPKRKARILKAPTQEVQEPKTPPPAPPLKNEVEIKPKPAPTLPQEKPKEKEVTPSKESSLPKRKKEEGPKDFHEYRPSMKRKATPKFDSRDRLGLRDQEEPWKRRRPKLKKKKTPEEEIVRPNQLKVRLPISIKDLAQEMKLKASELISKLFMQGITLTLNDYLDDETTIQLLGHEFGCDIAIDTSEEKRLRITEMSIQEEINSTNAETLSTRPPIVAFMGHVDHGKTSLIDAIRQTNITALEAGAITQHIGAFKSKTDLGELTILDTPGHEAFSEMRERGATVTDVIVLVIAGDEGIKEQTLESIRQAKEAKVPMVIAINKADKENFDEQRIYRELSDHELLPEAWGGTVITVCTSAKTQQGIKDLLELVLLQSEVLELKADPTMRARGVVLESQMHKGLGAVATLLVLNGSLKLSDAMVVGNYSARIKTMHDEHGKSLQTAPPSTPIKVTGLSDLPEAGCEFIVVENEKVARKLAQDRALGEKQRTVQTRRQGMESLLQNTASMKVLPLILKADVQGSLEALKNSIHKIHSKKVKVEIVHEAIGEISESDVQLASASKANIIGFHTRVESKAEDLIKQLKINVSLHNIIYHAVEEIKKMMTALLDKIEEEKDIGKAKIKAIFKSSQLGNIAGCQVIDGTIHRSHLIKLIRDKQIVWKGKLASLKREKEDVKEVQKGLECGIVLDNFKDIREDDIIQSYEIIYHTQEL